MHEYSSAEHVETRPERAGGAIFKNRGPVAFLTYPTPFAPSRVDAELMAIETHTGKTSGHVKTRPERAGGAFFNSHDPVTSQAHQTTSGREDLLHARSRHKELLPIHPNNPLNLTYSGVLSQIMSDPIESVPKHVKIPKFNDISLHEPPMPPELGSPEPGHAHFASDYIQYIRNLTGHHKHAQAAPKGGEDPR